MAKYDVFLVSALKDRERATLLAKRLRALKFKVWLDQNQNDDTFDSKDARDAENSHSIIVLWSKEAVKSDWVRAAASIGRSRKNTLTQLALDDTVPYEPFSVDERADISGLDGKNLPDTYLGLLKDISKRSGRKGLTQLVKIPAKDKAKKEKWFEKYPEDPLSVADFRKRGLLPTLAEERAKARAAAEASSANAAPDEARSIVTATGAATGLASATTAAVLASELEATADVEPTFYLSGTDNQNDNAGEVWWIIPMILACIGLLLLAAYFIQKRPVPASEVARVCVEDVTTIDALRN